MIERSYFTEKGGKNSRLSFLDIITKFSFLSLAVIFDTSTTRALTFCKQNVDCHFVRVAREGPVLSQKLSIFPIEHEM